MSTSRNLMTFLARASDGLMLVATMDNSYELEEYKTHAKKVLKMLRPTSPPKCVLEAGDFFFYYSIERNVIYLTLAERSYPRRLVFEYLRELSNAFGDEFGSMVDTMNRPYAAVAFDHRMEKIRAQFADPQAPSNFQRINSNLMDIHNVMSQNIQDIIQRGEKLERVEDKTVKMLNDSKTFKKYSRYINVLAKYKQMAPVAAVVLLVLLVLYFRFFR